jgi:hypothetical protein
MNAYTTRGEARIQQRDIEAVLRASSYLTGGSLAALEWRRGCQAEAELSWLLKQHGVTPQIGSSLISRLRQGIGATLVTVGQRLAGVPRGGVPVTAPALQGADSGDPSVIPALVATSASRP